MNRTRTLVLALCLAAGSPVAQAGDRVSDLEKLGENAGVFNTHLQRRPRPATPRPVATPPKPAARPQPREPSPEERERQAAAKERKRLQRIREAEERKRREQMAAKDDGATPGSTGADKPAASAPAAMAIAASPRPIEVATLTPEERTKQLQDFARKLADAAVTEAP